MVDAEDDQGTGLPDGYFARTETGKEANRILQNVGGEGRKLVPQSAPPTTPTDGDMYLADGTNWNPSGNTTATASVVVYHEGTSSWLVVANLGETY